jgi:hypothetical protein
VERSAGAFFLSVAAYLQRPVLIVFSVQLAIEFTSAAAPRTVLQAATARLPTIVAAMSNVRTIFVPPLPLWNDNESESDGFVEVN